MVANKLASVGFGLVALMHAILLATAIPHPLWSSVHAVALVAAGAGTAGLWRADARWGLALLAGGLLALAGTRGAILAASGGSGLVRTSIMLGGLALAGLAAAAWAARPSRAPAGRAATVRAALALVGIASFLSLLDAISNRPLVAMLALLVGTTGWALAAPNVEALPEHAAWTPPARAPKRENADGGDPSRG